MNMQWKKPARGPAALAGRMLAMVLLVFFTGPVFALGLGEMEVRSHLKQRLDVVIKLVVGQGENLIDLRALLGQRPPGSDRDLAPPMLLRQLTFEVRRDGPGAPYIQVRSKEPISEPAFSFPIEVLSPSGRLTRIYSVLLNPAGYVPRPRRTEPAETTAARRVPALRPTAPDTVEADGSYVVQPGDTLSAIGFRVRPDRSISGWQMALALFEANPDAFINGDVNRVKAGATLVIPSLDRIRSKTVQQARAEIIGVRSPQAPAPAAAPAPQDSAVPDQAAETEASEQSAAQPDYLFKILSPEEEQSLKLKQAEAAQPAASAEPGTAASAETAPGVTEAMTPEPAGTMGEDAGQAAPAADAMGQAERQKMNAEMQEITQESERLRGEVESLQSRLQDTNKQLIELAEIMKRQQEGSLFRFTGDRTTLSAVAALLVVLIGLLLLLLLRQSTIYMAARSRR